MQGLSMGTFLNDNFYKNSLEQNSSRLFLKLSCNFSKNIVQCYHKTKGGKQNESNIKRKYKKHR